MTKTTADMDKQNNHRDYGPGGIAFIGCIIAGFGIGWMIEPEFMVQGAIIGCGIGFIAMAFLARKD